MSFKDWWTNENNPSLPKSEYMFGTRHILMLAIAILSAIIISIVFYKKSEKSKRIVLTILISVLLFFEITSRAVNLIIAKEYTFENIFKIILPLHICSVAVCTIIISWFTKQKELINFSAIAGLLATIAFLLFPAVGINKTYISFTCLYSIVSHVTGFLVSILLMTLGFAKFYFKDMWKTYLCFALMFLWGAVVDFLILPGADYMYLRNDPLELNLSFPYHILYLGIILFYITTFYAIYYFILRQKTKPATKDQTQLLKK